MASRTDSEFDLVVVGGGIGGLATAALAQRLGLRSALLEAHTKLGGCAGYFQRGAFTFDAGATALVGFKPGEPIGDLLAVLEMSFETESTPSYRVHLPDRTLDIVPDRARFEESAIAAFGASSASAQRRFWRLQQWAGEALWESAAGVPRLPLRTAGDLVHDMKILGWRGALTGLTALVTVKDVLNILGLGHDRAFGSLIAILLQDTAQAGPDVVPFANAAACLQAYRRGMSRPRGGMQAFAEGIGHQFAALGGDLRTACLVDRIEQVADDPAGFVVVTRRRERLRARNVALNLPLDLAARLLGRDLTGRVVRSERKSRAAWSAFTGYVAIDRSAVDDSGPLFHQVMRSYDSPIHDGNNVLVSLSPLEDPGYGPASVRVATMSTHTRPADWLGLARDAYRQKKTEFEERLLKALGQALPEAPRALIHAEFASPRSFQRYTRRAAGAVGGAPVTRLNSNFLSVGSDVFGSGLWVVGDSVFPGQGTMATVLSAIRAVERIAGVSWSKLTRDARKEMAPAREVLDEFGSPASAANDEDASLVNDVVDR